MSNPSGSVIESQADWLTVSAHGQDRSRNLLDLALGLAAEEEARGGKPSGWRSMGYEGTHVGRIEYGQRDQNSTILRLSGDAAQEFGGVAHSLSDNVTRLDLALTWQARPADPLIGENAYFTASQHYLEDPRRAKPGHHADPTGGYTLHIGARASESYFRLYNKEAECVADGDKIGAERYKGCWRYELETKATVAQQLVELYMREDNQAAFAQRYLFAYCRAHAVEPAFPDLGAQRLIPGFRRRSDEDTKLAHLGKNVKPTVDWLREKGREEDVRRILGLA